MKTASDNGTEEQALAYLEGKYDLSFEIEWMKKGSTLLDNLYGDVKFTVHPKDDPEVIFTVEKIDDGFVDSYIPAMWSSELQAKLEQDILKELPEGAEFKLHLRNTNFNESMAGLSVEEFLAQYKGVSVSVIIGIKTRDEPNVEKYSQGIYNIYNLIKDLGVEKYVVSVGMVDETEDISDYIRTAYVNNIAWSNLDAKVYGEVNVDERVNPENPSNMIDQSYILHSPKSIKANYETFQKES